ncbi:hypothetical protein AAG570_008580 [Ranatra chinensis]|uniref:Uncharacterized protein n=1 Tax=Ranatra chinensis TaxID=642074 RepID=A0ABD0Z474_9HEMI
MFSCAPERTGAPNGDPPHKRNKPSHPNRLPDALDLFITSGLPGIHSLSQVLNDLYSDHSPVLTTSLDQILESPLLILTPGHTDWNYFARSLHSVINLRVHLKTQEDLDETVQELTLAVQRTARNSSPNSEI